MKILLVSDIHGDFNTLVRIYKKEKPDMVMFSGDGAKDFEEMSYAYAEAEYIGVKGNMDFDYDMPVRSEKIIMGKKIFLTHGHLYSVKRTYSAIIAEAEKIEADIVIFGHTHLPLNEHMGGIRLFNPGSVRNGDYGIMIIDESNVKLYNKSI